MLHTPPLHVPAADEPWPRRASPELRAKLVHEANQISLFFEAQPGEGAAEAVADHLARFWSPSRRRLLIRELQAGGEALRPVSRAAILKLARASRTRAIQGAPPWTRPNSKPA
jgi:formate dehydrogenase subunit delta